MSSIPIICCDMCNIKGEIQNIIFKCDSCSSSKCNKCDKYEVYNSHNDGDITFCSKCYITLYDKCVKYYEEYYEEL
jgi:hypothetical protein